MFLAFITAIDSCSGFWQHCDQQFNCAAKRRRIHLLTTAQNPDLAKWKSNYKISSRIQKFVQSELQADLRFSRLCPFLRILSDDKASYHYWFGIPKHQRNNQLLSQRNNKSSCRHNNRLLFCCNLLSEWRWIRPCWVWNSWHADYYHCRSHIPKKSLAFKSNCWRAICFDSLVFLASQYPSRWPNSTDFTKVELVWPG